MTVGETFRGAIWDSIDIPAEISVWFANPLAFVRAESGELENAICKLQYKKSCLDCSYDSGTELYMVQYDKVLDETCLNVDKNERKFVVIGSKGIRTMKFLVESV